ncbi:hypothetical protein Pmar_PMAR008506 [Perkinsus marinus ATCC 50983]|uniref:C3H1-type domain-containing protein n=1 Tax=Perkinsus marinus (strain ATCC 50983 / TXsc) TaxID=423536 RepID=C5L642_PERM5|nr:hypothetical protein Pmar_PMAR008506 [Perkinsus marinus ATCC 50983]EER07801.1 hypothetical protein Pmar_PMAR008506 [Perkinsus marinus ATCC 50983]|eukprot:XP_002775985.1 hypothetical protein Pmar_PMAR008506 [Perkinsus marinus ATCC 50983]
MANAGGRLTYSQLATALVMRERMITGVKEGSRGSLGKVNSVIETGNGTSKEVVKKKICYNWRRAGKCRFGKSCKFAHTDFKDGTASGPPKPPIEKSSVTVSSVEVSPKQPDVRQSEETVEITQRLLNIVDDDPCVVCAVSKTKEKLAGPTISIPLGQGKILSALLDTGAYYNYISASLVEKLGLATSSRGVSESLRVTLADGSVRQVVAVVDVAKIQFRVLQGGRNKYAILGVRSMCDCGVTLSFGVNSESERSVTVKGELKPLTANSEAGNDPVNIVNEDFDDGLSDLYQVEAEDDPISLVNQISDAPGLIVSGGTLSHPSKIGLSNARLETDGCRKTHQSRFVVLKLIFL